MLRRFCSSSTTTYTYIPLGSYRHSYSPLNYASSLHLLASSCDGESAVAAMAFRNSPSLMAFSEDYSKPINPFDGNRYSDDAIADPSFHFHRRAEAVPTTPGRPLFTFTTSSRRSSFSSKWDDAEKWLIRGGGGGGGGSAHASPSHHLKPSRKSDVFQPFVDKSRFSVHKNLPKEVDNGLPKDKFTNEVVPVSSHSDPTKEGFVFRNTMKDAATGMSPLGSTATSRCHTPLKRLSPARHNTPENRSGPLSSISVNAVDMKQLQDCHLAKLNLGKQFDSNWSSREEEEEDVSKSLRHFEVDNGCMRSISESRACARVEEEKTKSCLRYQREEARIQAWVELQSAKAKAQSKKLEVKIQRMRSDLEVKLMKKMGMVEKKAEELRAAAQLEHSEQIRGKTHKTNNSGLTCSTTASVIPISCGCLPCSATFHFLH